MANKKTAPDFRKLKLDSVARHVERGTVFILDDLPRVVTHIGDDGTAGDETTIHYGDVGVDGFVRGSRHMRPYELDRAFTEGRATFLDGAQARMYVTLPETWQEQVRAAHERGVQAHAARVESGKDALNDRPPETHPSYGVIRLSRTSGGHGCLFGSPFVHHQALDIDIYRASESRSLSNTRVMHEGLPLVSIRMSEAQFAQFITSVAVGEGTPCTLDYVWGQRMPEPPEQREVQEFHEDAQRTLKRAGSWITEAIEKVTALLEAPAVTKAQRRELLGLLRQVEKAYADSLPFTLTQFTERMEKIVSAGKLEIEGYLASRVPALVGKAPIALPGEEE